MTVRKRGNIWHYQFQVDNTTYCGAFPTADTKTKAKELEEEEKRKVRFGDRPISDDFRAFVNSVYLKYSKENKASYVHDKFRCEMLCDYFAGKAFKQVTSMTVVRFIKDRLASETRRKRPRSPVTVHKEVTLLSSIFLMAIREKVATANPCAEIPKTVRKLIKARKKRGCAMTHEKERLLFEKGLIGRNAHLRPVIRFDLDTGLRLGEATRLEVDHINLSERESKWFEIGGETYEVPLGCFIVTKSKNGEPRVIPMNSRARMVAKQQISDATIRKYLFPSSKTGEMIKEVKKGLATACKDAGIKYGLYERDGITFHTFRHWFSTKLEELGVSRVVRHDLLGYSPEDITDDYTHSTIEARRRAVELLCQTPIENLADFQIKSGKSLASVAV
jgi:integrase